MEINGKNYDLLKINGEILKKQLAENDTYAAIFEYFDNLDGRIDRKLSTKNLQNIFAQIQAMDNENGIQDNKLSDKEFNNAVKKSFLSLKITKDDLKNFVIKLLEQNEKNKIIEKTLIEKSYKSTKGEDRYNFKLGKKEHGVRTISAESVATKIETNSNGSGRNTFSSIYALIQNSQSSNNQTGYGGFEQGKRGDCYFVQEINSINNTYNGKAILDKNIKKVGEGGYRITLPGAVLLKNDLKAKGLESKCEITGIYMITSDAVSKLKQQAGKAYSAGNFKVMLMELAMESYREELARTNKNIGKGKQSVYTAEGAGRTHENDNLWGGFAWDAAFILTGQKSNVYACTDTKKQNIMKYQKGKYGFITREQMEARAKREMLSATNEKSFSEILTLTHSEKDLHSMLNRMQGNESNYAMSVGFVTESDGDDGVTKKNSGHALSVIKVTPTTVYVLNPWFKDEKGNASIEPIPRKDFEKMTTQFSTSKMDIKEISQTYLNITKNKFAEMIQSLNIGNIKK